jgi:phage protein D
MDLPLALAPSSPLPAFRRPVFEVTLGPGGGGDGALGGLGGLAGAAAGALGLSPGGAADPWKQHLVALAATCHLAPAVDALDLWLTPDPQAPAAAPGDAGSLRLGYADGAPELVFTGRVIAVRRMVAGPSRVTLASGATDLARLRVNRSYEKRTAGEIVGDLAGEAGVATGTVEDGLDLPFHVIDDRRSAWVHIAELARLCGFLAFIDPSGELTFAPPPSGGPAQTFTCGEDVLALDTRDGEPEVGEVTTSGEGAAGSQGADAWSWLIKDPAAVQGTAGGTGPARLAADPALRSGAAARQAAAGIAGAVARLRTTGSLLVPGAPAVTVGSLVEIAGAPHAALGGQLLVRGVRHRFDKRQGFVTRLDLAAVGGAAGGLLGGLGGAIGGLP